MQSIWKAGMAGVAAGLLMLACGGGSTTTTPTPTAPSETSSKAADLRTSLDLLLGEHLTLATKATNAALGGRTDEYTAYGQEITDNGQKIGDMMGVAFGDSAKEQFNKIWSAHNGFFVDYTKAVAAKDQAGEDKAVKNLTTQYVPKFTDLIAGATGLPKDTVQSLTTEHVLGTKKVVDDQAAKNWPAAYSDTRAAYLHMQAIGDPIAEAMAKKESDKFPGDASSKAAGFRSTLDMLLQEHLYLATSTTDAALAGRNEEVQGALPAVSANGIDLGNAIGSLYGDSAKDQFNKIWSAHNGFFVDYTTGVAKKDSAMQDKAVQELTTQYVPQFSDFITSATGLDKNAVAGLVMNHVLTTKQVVDDQAAAIAAPGATSWSKAAEDDGTAAHHMQMIGDPLAEAIVNKLPSKF